MRRHFSGLLRVQSHALLLFTTVPLCFLGYHIWLLHRNEGLSRRAFKNQEEAFHNHFMCDICLKHFTVQKRWKPWSFFLLLFKEKVNTVITSLRFPSWKHGHEVQLLGFHFDGRMSEWYWDVDVQHCWMHLVWIICLCVKHVRQTAVSKIIEKSNQRLKLHARFQQLNTTDCTQIFKYYMVCATSLLFCTCVWQLCVVLG